MRRLRNFESKDRKNEIMGKLPKKLETRLEDLKNALVQEETAAFDFETSDVRPREAIIAGLGVYLPHKQRCFYINVGHQRVDERFPKVTENQLAEAIRPFVEDSTRRMLMHNATYDLRLMFKLNLDVLCKVSCSLIHTHRIDENLKAYGADRVTHYYVPSVSYGLKELTTIFFNQKPPTLHDTIGKKNTISAPIYDVATYCAQDCVNSYNLYQRSKVIIDSDPQLRALADNIDDPNNVVLAKMMWEGIQIDVETASQQRDRYEQAIQTCREEIWKILGTAQPLDKPKQVLAALKTAGLELSTHKREILELQVKANSDGVAEMKQELLAEAIEESEVAKQSKVLALFLSKMQMQQRLSAFLVPMPEKVKYTADRLYADRFSSTLVTTRFSSSPNLQNLPGRADKTGSSDAWRELIPQECREHSKTRNIFIAKPEHTLVSIDLTAAEPRYLAMLFQQALTQRDLYYSAGRYRRQQMRRNQYPILIRKMLETRKPYTGKGQSEIAWPTYTDDPLWKVFKHGIPCDDPYNAMMIAMDRDAYDQAVQDDEVEEWLADNRWRGKLAFLALAYGSQAETLAPRLGWSESKTRNAIKNMENEYATLKPFRELTLLEIVHLGGVRSLAGRPRRINGYWQLTHPNPVTVGFYRMKPNRRDYQADIIPLGTTIMGVQAFVQKCCVEIDDGDRGEVVLTGNPNGTLGHISKGDPFAQADHFNTPPFRNINYNHIKWVRDEYGVTYYLSKQRRAIRQAFNARCQATGADHLRLIMNDVDVEVCRLPEFADCRLILTMHDSLVYEVPTPKVSAFTAAAMPIVERQPDWATVDIKAKVEIGRQFGEMQQLP